MAKNLKTPLGGAVDTTVVETALNNALGTAGYSDENINLMTVNDKIYAVRLANDAAGI